MERFMYVSYFQEACVEQAFLMWSQKYLECPYISRLKGPSVLKQYGGTLPGMGITSVFTNVQVAKITYRGSPYRDRRVIGFSVSILSLLPRTVMQLDWLSPSENV